MIGDVILEGRNVVKVFREGLNSEVRILGDSSFCIRGGELVSFVGPSGCGKSTVLQMCGLLDSPTAGDIVVNGISTNRIGDSGKTIIRKNSIGFIYQMHHLFPEFTALENVMLPSLVLNKESKKDIAKKAEKLLWELGLGDRANHIPAELSGGERQRVAIARAIINNPSIVLADEPTGNLDAENSEKIINVLTTTLRKINASLLMVTHDLNVAKRADRVITLRDHKIVDL
ncbi:MAG: ABC transporter ATP-binding protein [Rickettsiales bacterium]|jgi:lipoprotein-releasing system ATP-binding protein|nr:ABC transporter ATP-binding protein [Rickettsiales bacterium]